jgi:DNA-damage-inducible protein D
MEKSLVVFQDKKIRRTWFKDEWYFSVVDVVEALTDSKNPTDYLKKIRKRDKELAIYIGTNCPQVEIQTQSGKNRITLAGNTKDIFRIIQSIPSKKAEPFKQWLAQVGYERIQEIENPELIQERMKALYEAKGYPKEWIDKRLRGIAVRQNLTDEWKKRGILEEKDYAILTAEISKATFGLTPTEYKKLKNISQKSKENLRDHMTDLELIFTMLGERVTTEISENEKPNIFNESKKIAKRGGNVAGIARKQTEKELGRTVISNNNYFSLQQKKKKLN